MFTMTNRIEELASCNERIQNFFETGPVQRAAIEQFAELIVRECITAIYKSQSITPGFLINLPPDQLAFQIKKHFGVD